MSKAAKAERAVWARWQELCRLEKQNALTPAQAAEKAAMLAEMLARPW